MKGILSFSLCAIISFCSVAYFDANEAVAGWIVIGGECDCGERCHSSTTSGACLQNRFNDCREVGDNCQSCQCGGWI